MPRIPAPPPPLPGESRAETADMPDFSQRAAGVRERMDGPCTYEDWLAASRDLALINRLTRAYAPTLQFLERVVAARGVGYEPLHVVDIGCGHGDVLRRVARWAARRSLPVKLTGVDMNPYAVRAARECDREELVPPKTVEWVTADVFSMAFEKPTDVVISSLFTHHLADDDVVRFLRWCEAHGRWGWMINDLRRSERAYNVFAWMTRWMPWHPFLREDGMVSIRRGFVRRDWERLMGEARVEAKVRECGGGRLCVERMTAPASRAREAGSSLRSE